MNEEPSVHEYYRSETNRRLLAIESNIQKLLDMRSQLLTVTLILSGISSSLMSFIISVMKRAP